MKPYRLLTGALFLPILFLTLALPSSGAKPARFAVIGDRTGVHQEGVYEQVITEVSRLRPDFALTVGDMIEGYTVDTIELNRQWDEYKKIVRQLPCPLYFTPGNHDITFDAALPAYRRHIGEPYHSFMVDSLYFIVLDNSRRESKAGLDSIQMKWLVEELEKSKSAKYTFVTHHKPFWFELTAAGQPDSLHALFKKYGVDVVFNGHYHVYFAGQYDGVRYIDVGSSGGDTDPGISGLEYHFVWVTVDDDGIHVAPVKMGAVLPENEVTAAEYAFAQNVAQNSLKFESALPVNQNLDIIQNELTLAVNNRHQVLTADDTIRWDIPDGWSIEPAVVPVKLLPGDKTSLRFNVRKTGTRLYPAPNVSVFLPVAAGKSQLSRKTARLSRQAYCRKVTGPVVIDGLISESFWSEPNATLFDSEGGPMPTDSVFFYFAHDDSTLYLAARCLESKPDSIGAALSGHDAPVYGEDCVGFFFQPDINLDEVFQVYFSPNEAIFDQRITPNISGQMQGDPSWNGKYELKSSRGANDWTVEAKIPLAQWKTSINPGTEWGLNFRRKQLRLHTSADWQVPIDYEPESFGRLLFQIK